MAETGAKQFIRGSMYFTQKKFQAHHDGNEVRVRNTKSPVCSTLVSTMYRNLTIYIWAKLSLTVKLILNFVLSGIKKIVKSLKYNWS